MQAFRGHVAPEQWKRPFLIRRMTTWWDLKLLLIIHYCLEVIQVRPARRYLPQESDCALLYLQVGPQCVGLQVILQVIAVAGGCQKVDLRKTFHSNGAEDPAAAASAARAASAGIGGNCISNCHAPLVYRSRVVCVVTRPLVCCKCLPASEMHKVLVISCGCLAKSDMVTHRSLCVYGKVFPNENLKSAQHKFKPQAGNAAAVQLQIRKKFRWI